MIYNDIAALAQYGVGTGLIAPADRVWAENALFAALGLDGCAPDDRTCAAGEALDAILARILDDAVRRGVTEDGVTARDLLDTKLMGVLTPRPSQVIERFDALYKTSPRAATDWYYKFSGDTNYIRRDRIARDIRWTAETEYGAMEISINLSKPEKDPKAIAAAGRAKSSGYPRCQLCREAEGYAGRADYPARENHRIIPVTLGGEQWFLQYSPYVYYNEHCIALCAEHRPMKIDAPAFERLLDFIELFPHYFIGSNADLPIVGGSILSHDHFQGGRFTFPMERAAVEEGFTVAGFEDVGCGVVAWPMSVIRLTAADRQRLTALAVRILDAWRGYSDPSAFIFAETDGEAHNTITPIARMKDGQYQLDLVLRNNITTAEYPLGVFHPHTELHHIKKENIGLIEVQGLAVLPRRLKQELGELERCLVVGGDLRASAATAKHAAWAEELHARYDFTAENTAGILRREVGAVFARVLEHAGVFKRDAAGRGAFRRFLSAI